MAIFDIFKKKKKAEGKKGEKPKEKLIKKPKQIQKVEKKLVEKPVLKEERKRKKMDGAYRILKTPHITEKATDLMENNQYTFKVYENSNKQEVKKAVESVYGVDVVSVNMINIPRKRKRLGRSSGWKKGGKKAIVRIKKGQEIEIVPR